MTSSIIEPEFLLKAYACGIFPMAEDREDTLPEHPASLSIGVRMVGERCPEDVSERR